MASLVTSVVCARVLVDRDANNSATYVDVLDSIGVPTFPHPLPLITVATTWWRAETPDRIKFRIRIEGPSAPPVDAGQFDFDLPADKLRLRLNVRLQGTMLTGPGIYWFDIQQSTANSWESVQRIPLEVVQSIPQVVAAPVS